MEDRPGRWVAVVGGEAVSLALVLKLAVLAAVVAVLLALAWRAWGRRRGRVAPLRGCRWRKAEGRSGRLQGWVCRTCGVEAFTSDGRPPKECKRAVRERL